MRIYEGNLNGRLQYDKDVGSGEVVPMERMLGRPYPFQEPAFPNQTAPLPASFGPGQFGY